MNGGGEEWEQKNQSKENLVIGKPNTGCVVR